MRPPRPTDAALALLATLIAQPASAEDAASDSAHETAGLEARADAPKARAGPQLGVRVAYTDGLGVVYQGVNLSDASSGAVPILVDAGWRLWPELYIGAYGQYAPVFLKTYAQTCPAGWSCAAQDWRFGVDADYHFLPRVRLDPYVGLGAGYEILHTRLQGNTLVQAQNGSVVPANLYETLLDRGWEFASLSVGFDWRFSDVFGAGLFLMGTVGEYGVQTGTITATSGSSKESEGVAPIQMGIHGLAFVGARGTLNL